MEKERIGAIFIGLIMIGSIVGFALMSVRNPVQQGPHFENIINRSLTASEKVAIIRTGKVLVEYGWPENCTDCFKKDSLYRGFVQKWPNYITYSHYYSNLTIEQMIGGTGQILELKNITTESQLFELFCNMAYVQPKECLLSKI